MLVNDVPPIESACAPESSQSTHVWTVENVRNLVQSKFGKCACLLQIQAALALYGGQDVIVSAATGFGKTLTFWIPLLMALEEGLDKVVFIVTPLNLLGKQNVESLGEMGIPAVGVDGQSMNEKVLRVSLRPLCA